MNPNPDSPFKSAPKSVTMVSDTHLSTLPGSPFQFADPDPATWGIAYRLPREKSKRDQILEWLDFREKNGYECVVSDVFPSRNGGEEAVIKGALIYIALPSNPSFLGPASLDELAMRIVNAKGPSGPNAEYLFNLCAVVRQAGVKDGDLEELEGKVRELLASMGSGEHDDREELRN